MAERTDHIWKSQSLAATYLEGVRAAIPLALEQIDVMVRLLAEWSPYDAIVSGLSIHHQPDDRKRAVYGEIFGLLNPGGVFVNIEHVSSPTHWLMSLDHEMFVDSLHRHHPTQTREEVARLYYDRPDKNANILAPVEAQCAWLRDIGFTDVDCYLKVFEMAVFGGRRP